MREQKSGRKRKAPKNCEWRGDVLYGRKRIKGVLRRWSLRTGDVDAARDRVKEDIERMTAEVFYGDHRVKYADIVASWAERHILHEVGPRTAHRYAVSLKQIEPYTMGLFLDQVNTKEKIAEIVDGRRAAGVSTATIRRDLTALSSVFEYAEVETNHALAKLKKLKERRDPIMLPEPAHIQRVIARASGLLGALAHAAWKTGCRLDELVTSERTKLDHKRRQLTVIGKGNKLRVVNLNPEAYDVLRGLPPRLGCKWLFWQEFGADAQGKPIVGPLRDVSSRFAKVVRAEKKAAEKAAKERGHDEPDFRSFRFHDLRHRYAVDYLKDGGSIYDLQQELGHTSVQTTEIYLRFLTPEEVRVAKFGKPGEQREESQKESR